MKKDNNQNLPNYVKELVEVFRQYNSKDEITEFLNDILTPQELESVSKRLQIIKMLKGRMTQLEIVKRLGVGIATVTRGSTLLKKGRFKNISP